MKKMKIELSDIIDYLYNTSKSEWSRDDIRIMVTDRDNALHTECVKLWRMVE